MEWVLFSIYTSLSSGSHHHTFFLSHLFPFLPQLVALQDKPAQENPQPSNFTPLSLSLNPKPPNLDQHHFCLSRSADRPYLIISIPKASNPPQPSSPSTATKKSGIAPPTGVNEN